MGANRRRPTRGLERRFEAAMFDWDGTAVPDRTTDASDLRACIERLCELGFDVAVVSGTHVGNIDGQLSARPDGPGRLVLGLNRGSEVFVVDRQGPRLLERRVASAEEEAALTAAVELVVERLASRGLKAEIVSERLNRRKIDLIPVAAWADPPKARIAELLVAVQDRLRGAGISGLGEVVALARAAGRDAGLRDPRVTTDAKHVEIGLTDKSDSARWVFADLWKRGVGPALVLVAGDEMGPLGGVRGSDSFLLIPEARRSAVLTVGVEPEGVPRRVVALGGGPDAFLGVMGDQLRRREEGEPPALDETPGWTVAIDGFDPRRERAHEALLTLADGRLGTTGVPLVGNGATAPDVLLSGVYHREGPETELLPGPIWNHLGMEYERAADLRRVVDLRTGVQAQSASLGDDRLTGALFSSLARPGTAVLRATTPPLADESPLRAPLVSLEARTSQSRDAQVMDVVASREGIVSAAAETRSQSNSTALTRVATYAPVAERAGALRRLRSARKAGFERLLAEHRGAWASRWEDADIEIDGDGDLQLAVRFALFHLMASVASENEAAVGARGLSGPGYRGHVFWDADVFVLPFLAATHPSAARAMLRYRANRLPAARSAARAAGRNGARFPWESAATGKDVTPAWAVDRSGQRVAIRTGELEEHVTADVAWATACYLDWTGDRAVASGMGRQLLIETARYWASRVRIDGERRAHIDGVIGPDEYHEAVDDNAFTNVMVRWHLRRAAKVPGLSSRERERWLEIADMLVDGFDEASGLYEQHAGFFGLEPLIIAHAAPRRPVSAEALFGHERVEGAQVVKQADVLMLFHLLPDEVIPGSLKANLDFYEPRTAHGSSLSPGVHASVSARARRLDRAVELLRYTGRIDFDDLTGTTAAGLHLAAMGSIWQALVFGFLGARPGGTRLRLDPVLPTDWRALTVRLRFRRSRIRVRVERGRVRVHADRPVQVAVGDAVATAGPAGTVLPLVEGAA